MESSHAITIGSVEYYYQPPQCWVSFPTLKESRLLDTDNMCLLKALRTVWMSVVYDTTSSADNHNATMLSLLETAHVQVSGVSILSDLRALNHVTSGNFKLGDVSYQFERRRSVQLVETNSTNHLDQFLVNVELTWSVTSSDTRTTLSKSYPGGEICPVPANTRNFIKGILTGLLEE